MNIKSLTFTLLLGMIVFLGLAVAKSEGDKNDTPTNAASATSKSPQDDPWRLEGERRYHANCGRCHAAPPKFPPRMMATIIRHMRVRAMLTDKDMRLILHYMTE